MLITHITSPHQTFNNVVSSQVGLCENILSFGKNDDEFHLFSSELSGAADGIVLSETWFSATTCYDVQGYNTFHTYIVLTKQKAVSLFFSEIVTHRPIWPIFQCVMNIMRSV